MLSGLAGLQNEDISERIRSAQLLRDNLASDFLVDVGTLVDSLIKNLSESNQTLVLLCIDCLEAVISSYQSEILLKYDIDRLFETLLANFSDSKVGVDLTEIVELTISLYRRRKFEIVHVTLWLPLLMCWESWPEQTD